MYLRALIFCLMSLAITNPVNASSVRVASESTDGPWQAYLQPAADHPASEPLAAIAAGRVNSVDETDRTINISHSPIAAFGWPAMRMDFPVSASLDLSKLKPGEHVTFTLKRDAAENYTVTAIQPAVPDETGNQK